MWKRFLIPHHVTGFWTPRYRDAPIYTGSVGAGLLLDYAQIKLSGGEVRYNDLIIERGTIGAVVESPYPLGYGYAASAVLNIAKAVAKYGNTPEAYVEAHVKEVVNGTGLGDVLAIYTGGCLVVRTSPGAPGVGHAVRFNCPKAAAVTLDMAPTPTSYILQSRREQLIEVGGRIFKKFMSNPSFDKFLELSYIFSKELGFLPPWAEELRRVKGHVGMYAKKGVLVIIVESDWVVDTVEFLKKRGVVHISHLVERSIVFD
ncbi:MAG: GHMP kinase [Pyrobaculum sp.]